MKRLESVVASAVAVLATSALAERGLVTAALQAGQVLELAPVVAAERRTPMLGTLTYGLSERWSLASGLGLEFQGGGPTLGWFLGPRLSLFRNEWWSVEALLTPEVLWRPSTQRVDLSARAGVAVRWLMMWGVGLALELGARGRFDAQGPFTPALEAYAVGGLYIEA
ncbi:MAG: hypothetical protein JNJ54_10300 [Myxococcaceae bacterium]|nr:hypothetical protein [Myxococcaceae bacterium]